ncbi:GDSL family lipase [Paenibacillus sp. N4]|uniref:GDSL-type esterase/lipase family protein n=1 Tax=Paenibacillus vietnamensis TaxID=2590547 RepID=UPI001CD18FCB|nr:GDSL-type esterase/lipase family protein [Paenibacillus vietnamensis]MCA0755115.1 GDSL family lipase [Paenibacillus vietnamensis]
MHSRKVRWLTLFAAITCLLWIAGLGWAAKDYLLGNASGLVTTVETDEAPPPEPDTFRIVALGDSLTRGMGDNEGKGYVGYAADRLKEEGWNLSVVNLGIKGLTSAELLKQLEQKEIRRQLGEADAVMMTIGANDLFMGGETLSRFTEESIGKLEDGFLTRLNGILAAVRELNPEADVYVLGLYDPFAELEQGAETSRVVREWNHKTMEAAAGYPGTVFVPVYDLFQRKVGDYLFTDRFHPNEKGYKLMAERVAGLIDESEGGPQA